MTFSSIAKGVILSVAPAVAADAAVEGVGAAWDSFNAHSPKSASVEVQIPGMSEEGGYALNSDKLEPKVHKRRNPEPSSAISLAHENSHTNSLSTEEAQELEALTQAMATEQERRNFLSDEGREQLQQTLNALTIDGFDTEVHQIFTRAGELMVTAQFHRNEGVATSINELADLYNQNILPDLNQGFLSMKESGHLLCIITDAEIVRGDLFVELRAQKGINYLGESASEQSMSGFLSNEERHVWWSLAREKLHSIESLQLRQNQINSNQLISVVRTDLHVEALSYLGDNYAREGKDLLARLAWGVAARMSADRYAHQKYLDAGPITTSELENIPFAFHDAIHLANQLLPSREGEEISASPGLHTLEEQRALNELIEMSLNEKFIKLQNDPVLTQRGINALSALRDMQVVALQNDELSMAQQAEGFTNIRLYQGLIAALSQHISNIVAYQVMPPFSRSEFDGFKESTPEVFQALKSIERYTKYAYDSATLKRIQAEQNQYPELPPLLSAILHIECQTGAVHHMGVRQADLELRRMLAAAEQQREEFPDMNVEQAIEFVNDFFIHKYPGEYAVQFSSGLAAGVALHFTDCSARALMAHAYLERLGYTVDLELILPVKDYRRLYPNAMGHVYLIIQDGEKELFFDPSRIGRYEQSFFESAEAIHRTYNGDAFDIVSERYGGDDYGKLITAFGLETKTSDTNRLVNEINASRGSSLTELLTRKPELIPVVDRIIRIERFIADSFSSPNASERLKLWRSGSFDDLCQLFPDRVVSNEDLADEEF